MDKLVYCNNCQHRIKVGNGNGCKMDITFSFTPTKQTTLYGDCDCHNRKNGCKDYKKESFLTKILR